MPFTRTLFYDYDIPADLTYGRFLDQTNIRGFIQTSGSSVTTTAVEPSGDGATPFDQVAVDDWLLVETDTSGTQLRRRVATKASSTSITVNSAWDLSGGKAAKLLPFRSGTAATDGRVFVGTLKNVTVSWNLTTLGATDVRLVVEAKMSDPDAVWTTLLDRTMSATESDSFSVTEPWSFVRVGVEETTGSGTDSIDVYLTADDNVSV